MSSFSWPVITSANPSVGGTGATAPSSATEIAGVDGTGKLIPVSVDSAGVVQVNIPGTIPVSGTVTANQGTAGASAWPVSAAQSGTWNITNVSGAVSLPTGASTLAGQTTGNTSLSSIDGKLASLGQKAMAGSEPVVIASDQSSIPVTVAAGSAIIGKVSIDQTTPGTTNGVQVNAALPAGTNVIGALSANQSCNTAQINGVAPLMGNGATGTGSLRVTLASDTSSNTNAFLVSEQKSSTATLSSVASSATTVSLLSSNASRMQATFFNDSTQVLYIAFAATASTSAYTVQVAAGGYYELPNVRIYTGAISGIWASANGNARITELT